MNTASIQVADAVIVRGHKVLLVQQRKAIAHGLWSYPGGHVEHGETLEEAVTREVEEELGLQLVGPKFFKTYPIDDLEGPLEIHTFLGSIDGDIALKHDELLDYRWFTLEELEGIPELLRSSCVIDQAKDALEQLSR